MTPPCDQPAHAALNALEGQDITAFTQAFFHGVFSHDLGATIWNTCADQRCSGPKRSTAAL
jgi:hypothetical protein